MAAKRDDFTKAVVDNLGKRASYICSNPDCRAQTLAPSESEESKYLYIGKAAHISAAAEGGPRFDPDMSSEERCAITNAIFLCSNCADKIDKNNGADFSTAQLRQWKNTHEKWVGENLNKRNEGGGGEGGSGTIIGDRGTVIGGRGGDGGISGVGGKGGGGLIQGDDGLIIGGDGGSCPTADGRGGRGARGPAERSGLPTEMWGFGRGGSSSNHPEYNRRLGLLQTVRLEYLSKFRDDVAFIEAGIDQVPIDWVNQRLVELGENWQVQLGPTGYLLPPLPEDAEPT
jgi:hypothetical protein